jgi:DNA (cytosine-5)-methyltransferase 1
VILDLFAGPGGWDEGLRLLGVTEPVVGVEWDKDACATAVAAGHERILADVREVPTNRFPSVEGLIASPPCQTFSLAGVNHARKAHATVTSADPAGRSSITALSEALALVAHGYSPAEAAAAGTILGALDKRSTLVLEPMRFIRALAPIWVAMENVPGVLPVWKVYADLLAGMGYSTWAGTLNAADYGLPQARRRSFLLATCDGTAGPPEPTHAKGGAGGLLPWVTMASALDLGPRPDDLTAWAWDRPATTVVRTFCPEVISAPGYRRKGDPPRQRTPGSITCTHEQMCILQGVRPDYPFAGGTSKRGSLIGAMLPPPWAVAILGTLVPQGACIECGNDDPCIGYSRCSDCMEEEANEDPYRVDVRER